MSRSDARTTKVYVGGLPANARKEELEEEFSHFGKLQDVWVARNPPGFAFVEFYEERDADEACKELDGRRLCGKDGVRVEISHGKSRGRGRGGGRSDRRDDRYRSRRYNDDDRGYGGQRRGRSRSPPGRYSPPRGGRRPRSRSRSPNNRYY